MGAWGTGIFENDDACDFALEVQKGKDMSGLEAVFDRVLNVGEDYLEASEASEALAAADIVARLRGKFGQRDAYTEGIDQWVERVAKAPSDGLLIKARGSVARVMQGPSELLELWDEGDSTEFTDVVKALQGRLQ